MTDTVVLPSGGEEVSVPAEGPLNIREAVASLNQRRDEQVTEAEKRGPDGRFTSQKVEESAPTSQEADAAPPPEAPGETIEADPAEELPPIAPPRSWTKEDKEAFANLPRETQERISDAEKKRERDFRSRQNETAELAKRHQAELQAAHNARQQYEAALPQLALAYQTALANDFADIRSPADVDRLAIENPSRWVAYQNVRQKNAEAQAQLLRRQQAQAAAVQAQWQKWSAEQDAKVMELIPDLADPQKSGAILKEVESLLNDVGYTKAELKEHFSGQRVTNFRDSRVQQILWEAAQYRKAKADLQKAKQEPKPAPKVQRPGSPRTSQDAGRAKIQTLEKQFGEARGAYAQARVAAELRRAKRSLAS